MALRAVLRSDLDVGAGSTPAQVAQAAAASWDAYAAIDADALFASHTAAWAGLWAGGGIELSGNASFAATVNASLYDILSSLRADWNWCAARPAERDGASPHVSFRFLDVLKPTFPPSHFLMPGPPRPVGLRSAGTLPTFSGIWKRASWVRCCMHVQGR